MVADYHARTYINDEDYWKLIPHELNVEKSPKTLIEKIYVRIHEWCGRRPQIQPPHVDDLLNLMMRYFHVKIILEGKGGSLRHKAMTQIFFCGNFKFLFNF
jgi:hypothetical protein